MLRNEVPSSRPVRQGALVEINGSWNTKALAFWLLWPRLQDTARYYWWWSTCHYPIAPRTKITNEASYSRMWGTWGRWLWRHDPDALVDASCSKLIVIDSRLPRRSEWWYYLSSAWGPSAVPMMRSQYWFGQHDMQYKYGLNQHLIYYDLLLITSNIIFLYLTCLDSALSFHRSVVTGRLFLTAVSFHHRKRHGAKEHHDGGRGNWWNRHNRLNKICLAGSSYAILGFQLMGLRRLLLKLGRFAVLVLCFQTTRAV